MGQPAVRALRHEPALDGVRGFAILLVMVWHFAPVWNGGPVPHFKAGHIAIDLFFALSGFLITALLLREHRSRSTIHFTGFYQRRFFRLIPALVVFLCGHLVFAALTDIPTTPFAPGTEWHNEIPSVLYSQLFILNQAYHFHDFTVTLGMGHLWSLAVEEQFYLVWPSTLYLLMGARSGRRPLLSAAGGLVVGLTANHYFWFERSDLERVALVLGTALIISAILVLLAGRNHDAWVVGLLASAALAANIYKWGYWENPTSAFGLYSNTLARADQLLFGAILAVLWTGGWIPRRAPAFLTLLGWGYYIFTIFTADFSNSFFARGGWTSTGIASALIVWGSLDGGGPINGRILATPWLRWMGKTSYGMYLWHGLLLEMVEHVWGDQPVLFRAVVGLGLSFGAAIISWNVVERPLMAYNSRRQAAARKARGEPSTTSTG